MTLYTKSNSTPAPLPFRITLSNGMTRTDPTTFTPEEIADAGYTEAPARPDGNATWDRTLGNWIVLLPQPDVTDTQIAEPETAPTQIDGVWTRGWTIRDKTPEEILASLPYKTAAEAKAAMVAWIDGLTAQVMSQYPQAVQARWPIEEAAARAVIAGTATQEQTDLVTNEGAAKGRTPTEHADAIIANADRFMAIANEINKLFLATDKALTDATDPAQYEGILQAAIAQAAPLAQAYGLEVS